MPKVRLAYHKYLIIQFPLAKNKTKSHRSVLPGNTTTVPSLADVSLALLQIKQLYLLLSMTLTRILATQIRNINLHISFSINYFDRW